MNDHDAEAMTVARISPTLRQRRLGMLLRELRSEDGRTSIEVARALGWSPSKVQRLEDAPRKPVVKEIIKLLDAYGVGDPKRGEILELVAQARQRGWWDTYRTSISRDYDMFIGLENEAKTLRTFEIVNIPGLLQTAGYARALMTARRPDMPAEEIEARVAVRTARQEHLLTGPDPVRLWAVLSEGALRRQVGGAAVMRDQLEHLLKVAELPNVTIQVLDYAAGAAPAAGPFVVIDFARRTDLEVVYLETPGGAIWVEEKSETDRYLLDFVRLVDTALTMERSLKLIGTLAGSL
ncbi:helix-turn-helix domain-containing protein [Actinomadura nitritigenes]|uniref:helix-turn-helix domain-containing protein n=1 Tax=Actinomadura nitritigenes TaxID=134602 RepID=UPI003D8CD3F2